MDKKTYDLHLLVGKLSGVEKTCGKKIRFETLESAQKGSDSHNKWEKRKHDVEPYPCFFCNQYHIGGIMKQEILEKIVEEYQKSNS